MTMRPFIECVPNFSEGRDPAVVHALIEAVTAVPGVWLLHHTMDADHHRSVLTFAGLPDAVGEAALRAFTAATELIDIDRHDGVHPRIGATDVVPFVPIHDADMEECIRLARTVGQQVGTRLGIPVFLYEPFFAWVHFVMILVSLTFWGAMNLENLPFLALFMAFTGPALLNAGRLQTTLATGGAQKMMVRGIPLLNAVYCSGVQGLAAGVPVALCTVIAYVLAMSKKVSCDLTQSSCWGRESF